MRGTIGATAIMGAALWLGQPQVGQAQAPPGGASTPDYWVGLSPAPAPIQVEGGEIRRVLVIAGNSGGPGAKEQYVEVIVRTETVTQVCFSAVTIEPPRPGNPVVPLVFQVLYRETAGPPPVRMPATYEVTARIRDLYRGTAPEDVNPGNNEVTLDVELPGDGEATCAQARGLPVPPEYR